MVECFYCGKKFKSKKAVFAHLQFCLERRKARDLWARFPISSESFSGNLCVLSRSPKTLKFIEDAYEKVKNCAISVPGFFGYVQALADQKLIVIMTEPTEPESTAAAPREAAV